MKLVSFFFVVSFFGYRVLRDLRKTITKINYRVHSDKSIENQVINETEIKVEFADALERTKSLFAQQMSQYGSEVTEDDIESAAKNYLSKNEESRQIYEQLMQEKLLNVYKETLNLKTKEVSFDDFVKLATGNNPKKGILDSLSNLVKM